MATIQCRMFSCFNLLHGCPGKVPCSRRFTNHARLDHTDSQEERHVRTTKFFGRVRLRAVHYETTIDPVLMLNCHCRACQQAGGSGYAPIVVVPKEGLQLHGELRYHRSIGDNGKAVERGFCPNCGSQIAMKLESMPGVVGLQAGSLADPSRFVPAMDVFTNGAQPWDHMQPERKKFPRGLAT
jgi:hypothetical protein